MRALPPLQFSEYFLDHNHEHNVDEEDVLGAIEGRRIYVSGLYRHRRDGKPRRVILGKTNSDYLTIICEPAEEFWWIISAWPSNDSQIAKARAQKVGDDL